MCRSKGPPIVFLHGVITPWPSSLSREACSTPARIASQQNGINHWKAPSSLTRRPIHYLAKDWALFRETAESRGSRSPRRCSISSANCLARVFAGRRAVTPADHQAAGTHVLGEWGGTANSHGPEHPTPDQGLIKFR